MHGIPQSIEQTQQLTDAAADEIMAAADIQQPTNIRELLSGLLDKEAGTPTSPAAAPLATPMSSTVTPVVANATAVTPVHNLEAAAAAAGITLTTADSDAPNRRPQGFMLLSQKNMRPLWDFVRLMRDFAE
eukprot:gene12202-12339_t